MSAFVPTVGRSSSLAPSLTPKMSTKRAVKESRCSLQRADKEGRQREQTKRADVACREQTKRAVKESRRREQRADKEGRQGEGIT